MKARQDVDKQRDCFSRISGGDLVELVRLEPGPVLVSIADWEFLLGHDDEILHPLRTFLVAEVESTMVPEDVGREQAGPVGFFSLNDELRRSDFLERLARYSWARLYLGGFDSSMLKNIPACIVAALEIDHEPSEELLFELFSLPGYTWLVLSDGNPGDTVYYYCEGAVSRP